MKNKQSFWIKERYNPQTGTYYVARGQMSKSEAKQVEKDCLYGRNKMLEFKTEEDYINKIRELQLSGERVQ